jgi:hypothetical protein
MKRASALCASVDVCQSVTNFAFWTATRSDGGATMNPRRDVGCMVFEKEPTYMTASTLPGLTNQPTRRSAEGIAPVSHA